MARQVLDVIGEVCPVPLILAKERMQSLDAGDELVILTDFTRTVRNVIDWADAMGYHLTVAEEEGGVWRITVRKER